MEVVRTLRVVEEEKGPRFQNLGGMYWCQECGHEHSEDTNIGRRHSNKRYPHGGKRP